jgi:hypothetical protein
MNPEEISKPKPMSKLAQAGDRIGSKTAPLETDFSFDPDHNEDYISTYNYYIYYHNMKPRDPRLPKPTYQQQPNIDFIKGEAKLENNENDEDYLHSNIQNIIEEKDKNTLEEKMNNLNLNNSNNNSSNNNS